MCDGLTHPSHCGALSLIKKVIQSHKEISRLHLCTLAPCYVTAAAALTALHGAALNTYILSNQCHRSYVTYNDNITAPILEDL